MQSPHEIWSLKRAYCVPGVLFNIVCVCVLVGMSTSAQMPLEARSVGSPWS